MTPELAPQPRQNDEATDREVSNEAVLALQGPVLNSLFAGDEVAMLQWLPTNGHILRAVVSKYLKEGGDPEQVEAVVEKVRERLAEVRSIH